jgi:ArsR family transcriptional regulator, arsenate/arsenite/antimonite-responsive transcriptional repressor
MATMNQASATRSMAVPTSPVRPMSVLGHRATVPPTEVNIAPKFVPTLTEAEAVNQARLLKALADPTRLRILSLLSRHEGEVCVFEIVESFTLEQPTISHHLRILRDAGLVDCRKKGLWAYYYVRRDALGRAQEVINGLA